jgi:hypothetical protein
MASVVLGFLIIIHAMAPMMPPLTVMHEFVFGPGFYILIGWWMAAVCFYLGAWITSWRVGSRRRFPATSLAWCALVGLIGVQLLILADFQGVV